MISNCLYCKAMYICDKPEFASDLGCNTPYTQSSSISDKQIEKVDSYILSNWKILIDNPTSHNDIFMVSKINNQNQFIRIDRKGNVTKIK